MKKRRVIAIIKKQCYTPNACSLISIKKQKKLSRVILIFLLHKLFLMHCAALIALINKMFNCLLTGR